MTASAAGIYALAFMVARQSCRDVLVARVVHVVVAINVGLYELTFEMSETVKAINGLGAVLRDMERAEREAFNDIVRDQESGER